MEIVFQSVFHYLCNCKGNNLLKYHGQTFPMNIKKAYGSFLCFLSAPSIQAQRNYIDIPNYILCINSYAESTPWSTRMISTISEYVQKAPPTGFVCRTHEHETNTENYGAISPLYSVLKRRFKDHMKPISKNKQSN